MQRNCLSWHWRAKQNLKKKLSCGLENDMRNLTDFYPNIWMSKLRLDKILLSKLENAWAKNLKSWCVMTLKNDENLKSNCFVVSKLTWWIWQFLTQVLESLKNLHINRLFLTKLYNVWAIFHDTEEWCKTWRKTDLWFGKWYKEYVFTRARESLKIGTLMEFFYPK